MSRYRTGSPHRGSNWLVRRISSSSTICRTRAPARPAPGRVVLAHQILREQQLDAGVGAGSNGAPASSGTNGVSSLLPYLPEQHGDQAQYLRPGAKIDGERHMRARALLAIAALQTAEQRRLRAAKAVDALLDVADDEEVVARRSARCIRGLDAPGILAGRGRLHAFDVQQLDQPHLQRVGVLELVDHQVAEPPLVTLAHLREIFEQAHALRLEIVVVDLARCRFASSYARQTAAVSPHMRWQTRAACSRSGRSLRRAARGFAGGLERPRYLRELHLGRRSRRRCASAACAAVWSSSRSAAGCRCERSAASNPVGAAPEEVAQCCAPCRAGPT